MTLVVSFSVLVSVFSFEQHRDNTEAADATGEETKENIRSGNEPESKQVDSWIAVVLRWGNICLWPVDTVDPDTACDEPAAQEEGDKRLDRVGGLGVLVITSLSSPHTAQNTNKIFKCWEWAWNRTQS